MEGRKQQASGRRRNKSMVISPAPLARARKDFRESYRIAAMTWRWGFVIMILKEGTTPWRSRDEPPPKSASLPA